MTQETKLFKVIWVDNYAREYVADCLVKDNLSRKEADALCAELCNDRLRADSDWWRVVPQNYRLSRGIEDLI